MIWIHLIKILVAAEKVGISGTLLFSLCHVETTILNKIHHHDGGSKSYGICQVKLRTARQFLPGITEAEMMDPYYNALAAAYYLKYQTLRFKDLKKGISAYNAGRPIKSNKKYVKSVLAMFASFDK